MYVPTKEDCAKVMDMLSENHIWVEDIGLEEVLEGTVMIFEIRWGDWKHEHLRANYLVEKMFPMISSFDSVVTEENGSDCYSAKHLCLFPHD